MDAAGLVEDDEGLWDELSHQQSREMQQHRARVDGSLLSSHHQSHINNSNSHTMGNHAALTTVLNPRHYEQQQAQHHPQSYDHPTATATTTGAPPLEAVQRVARRAADEMGRFTQTVYQGAMDTYQQHQQQRQHQRKLQRIQQRQHNITRTDEGYLDDFGLPSMMTPNSPHHNERQYHPQEDPLLTSLLLEEGHDADSANKSNNPYNNKNVNAKHDTNNPFVLLSFPGQHPQHHTKQHDSNLAFLFASNNLDVTLNLLYRYYYHRGWVPWVLGHLAVEYATLILTLILSWVLLGIHWHRLIACHDEATCHADFWQGYYGKIDNDESSLTAQDYTWVRLYFSLFVGYAVWQTWSFYQQVQDANRAKHVYENILGISAHKLEGGAVDWEVDVCQKLSRELMARSPTAATGRNMTAPPTSTARPANESTRNTNDNDNGKNNSTNKTMPSTANNSDAAPDPFDALTVAHRIMRKENFIIALFNCNILNLTVPFLENKQLSSSGLPFYYCGSLEWSLYFCIFNFLFNHKYHVRPAFYLDAAALQRRFQLCGLAHLLFLPFLLFVSLLHFGFRNAYDWKSTRQYLGPREWSREAQWNFREFNELPHNFERRLAPSYNAAQEYLKLFGPNEIMTAAGRILTFVGGSIGAVLFAFAAINDAILLHVKIADWNLLWFAGVAGVAYSVGKSLSATPVPSNDPDVANDPNAAANSAIASLQPHRYIRNMYAARDAALKNVSHHTHYYPDIWKGRGWDKNSTHKDFSNIYQYKAQLFLHEAISLILAPYILCFSLPSCAQAIVDFVATTKTVVPGAGEVCGYATFDFDQFGDETWEGRTLGATLVDQGQAISTGAAKDYRRKTRHGKMEKSFFTFKATHPNWTCPESGQHLVNRLQQYQQEETTREQQLHIEAAARQLETLTRLEREAKSLSSTHNQYGDGSLAAAVAAATAGDALLGETGTASSAPIRDIEFRSQASADAGAGSLLSSKMPPTNASVGQVQPPFKPRGSLVRIGPAVPVPPPPMAFSSNLANQASTFPSESAVERQPSDNSEDAAPFAVNSTASSPEDPHSHPGPANAMSVSPLVMQRPSAAPAGRQHPPLPMPIPQSLSRLATTTTINAGGAEAAVVGAPPPPQGATSLALSADILRLLNMSTLETGSIFLSDGTAAPVVGEGSLAPPGASALPRVQSEERQYMWLERYHAHVAAQQQQGQEHLQRERQDESSS